MEEGGNVRQAIRLEHFIQRAKDEGLPIWVQTALKDIYVDTYEEAYRDGQEDLRTQDDDKSMEWEIEEGES
jgi:hypothetical protein